jgi:cell wall-associated NlpC family hydrolase
VTLVAALIGVVGVLAGVAIAPLFALTTTLPSAQAAAARVVAGPSADPAGFVFTRLAGPDRTVVTDRAGTVVATFTDGARTVAVTGPERTFAEPRFTHAAVRHTTWVRLAPEPWTAAAADAPWVRPWLTERLADTSPDVLAVATEYLHDSPAVLDENGVQVAGNASFGPEVSANVRDIGSDFYDYLGVPWAFPDDVEKTPEANQFRALDCSGYLRVVLGYRLGYPLLGWQGPGPGLPRRANDMATTGPGTDIIGDRGARPTALDGLQPGDVLFFSTDDQPDIDHSGFYLGVDTDGLHRFLSSRNSPDGPTMGDLGGPSVLDGEGWFAERFRSARRV